MKKAASPFRDRPVHYRLVNHTADMGIVLEAESLPVLFENAALALGDLLLEGDAGGALTREKIVVSGGDLPDLLVNWLREILYRWAGEGKWIRGAAVMSISGERLEAEVGFVPYDAARHSVCHDIKAVTYHRVAVEKTDCRWRATVIFDV